MCKTCRFCSTGEWIGIWWQLINYIALLFLNLMIIKPVLISSSQKIELKLVLGAAIPISIPAGRRYDPSGLIISVRLPAVGRKRPTVLLTLILTSAAFPTLTCITKLPQCRFPIRFKNKGHHFFIRKDQLQTTRIYTIPPTGVASIFIACAPAQN